jgi:hypothetical protein
MVPDPTSGVTRGPCKHGFDCGLFRLPDLDTDIGYGLFLLPDLDILILTADSSVTDPDFQILK